MRMTAKEVSDIREMARRFAASSIVAEATARLVEQVLLEVHETQIAPRDKRIAELEAALNWILNMHEVGEGHYYGQYLYASNVKDIVGKALGSSKP